jgi:hypothetical protein
VAAHLQHHPAARATRRLMPEARIEKAGIMDTELADQSPLFEMLGKSQPLTLVV